MDSIYKISSISAIGSTKVGKGWMNKANKGFNRMYYVNGGTGGYLENGRKIRFKHGALYFLPYYSNFVLYTDLDDNLDVTYIDFKLSTPVLSSNVYCVEHSASPIIELAIKTFRALCETPNRGSVQLEYLKETVAFLVSEAVCAQPQVLIHDETVITALNIMHADISKKITVSDIAKKCFLSTDGLIRKFTKSVGDSPYSYLKKLRLQTAIAMKAEGLPLSQIAEECGYSDSSALLHALSKTFSN